MVVSLGVPILRVFTVNSWLFCKIILFGARYTLIFCEKNNSGFFDATHVAP